MTATLPARRAGDGNAPQGVAVSVDTWRAAAVAGGLRTGVNDRFRARVRDRGDERNLLADVQGAFGELVAAAALEHHHGPGAVRCPEIVDFDGPPDACDLTVRPRTPDDGPAVRVEAKAHLHQPAKRWLLVNRLAVQRSRARGADGYLPVIAALGSDRAIVGRLLACDEVEAWPPAPRHVSPRDPAVGLPLTRALRDVFGATTADRALAQPSRLTAERILALARAARRAARSRPDLGVPPGASVAEVRDALARFADQIAGPGLLDRVGQNAGVELRPGSGRHQ